MRRGAGRGANFGWRPFEGRSRYTHGESAPGAIGPVDRPVARRRQLLDHRRRRGARPRRSSLRGRYVFGDFCRGRIESARLTPGRARDVRNTLAEGVEPLLVRRGRAGPRLRRLARGPGLPARAALSAVEILLVRAPNPSPYTLDGTNTLGRRARPGVGRRSGPGARRAPRRARRRGRGARRRGRDRADARPSRPRRGGRAAARAARRRARRTRSRRSRDGDAFGPFTVLHVPGHAADHLVFVAGAAAFTGDAVLGEGSVFLDAGRRRAGGRTSTGCGGCARWGSSGSTRATAPRSPTRRPSSTSTSRTGSSASGGIARRARRGRPRRGRAARRRLGRRARRAAARGALDAAGAPGQAARRGPGTLTGRRWRGAPRVPEV